MPFDYKKAALGIALGLEVKCAVPMNPEILADLGRPGAEHQRDHGEAAAATGIPGLLLIAGCGDKACEVIGAGAWNRTSAASAMAPPPRSRRRKRYIEPILPIPPYPAAIPHAYNLEVQITAVSGWWLVQDGVRPARATACRGTGRGAGKAARRSVADVPPGCDGLMLQPYWSPGLKVPGPEAMGAVIGFTDVHARPSLPGDPGGAGLRAARGQGAAGAARRHAHHRAMRIAGGGSQSDAAGRKLTADIFGLPPRPHVYETSGLGGHGCRGRAEVAPRLRHGRA